MLLRWKSIILTFVIVLSCVKESQAKQNIPVYTLVVRIFPERHKIEGTARIAIPEGSEIKLVFSNLNIKKLLIDGLSHKITATTLTVRADAQIKKSVDIEYSAEFKETVQHKIADTTIALRQNVIAETGIMLLNGWYPGVEERCFYNLTVKIPEYFDAVSESESSVATVSDGLKIISFNFPYPLPSLSLVAGRYITRSYSYHGIIIKTYFFAEDQELSEKYLAHAKRYLEMYEALLGTFPFKSFAIVENNYQTGYSFPTYTLLGSQVIKLPFIVEISLGHEILHQWFGNCVYVDEEQGNWAEGIVTYLADHWYSHLRGQGASYRKKLLTDYMNYVDLDNEIPLSDFKRPDSFATRAVGYNKAALVFHMLRLRLGDDNFFKSLKQFINTFRFKEAGWRDINDVFITVTNTNLNDFLQQWLRRKGAPALTITRFRTVFRENSFLLAFDIVQDNEPPFILTIPLRVITDKGDEVFSIEINAAQTHCERALAGRPLKIIVDENYDTLRRLSEDEIAPVLSAFFGDTGAMVILPEKEEKFYQDVARYYKSQGYRIRKERDASLEEIKTCSALILSDRNSFYRKLFAGESLPDGGCVVKAYKNPLSSRHVVVVMTGKTEEEIKPVYRKLARYGNYSLLIFEKGSIRTEQSAAAEQGIVEELSVPVSGVKTRDTVNLNAIVHDIENRRVIYIGESHTAYTDHVVQLEIIRRLYELKGRLIIGMEMFQRPFQKYLDEYVAQKIGEEELLKKTEYFARWGYDYNLYRDILNFARAHAIPVIALNLRKEITEKVAEKGMDVLSDRDRTELPATMNLNDQNYRSYLKQVFLQHEKSEKMNFERFYLSQIFWDETMAHSVADALAKYPESQMVVLVGSGHLQYAWGIPARVRRLTNATSAIILNDSGQGIERGLADFILFSKPMSAPESPRLQVMLKKEKEGVVIDKVIKDGPGDKAGLKEKDVIIKIDAKTVSDIDDVKILLLMKNRGDTVNVMVRRKMQELTIKAEL